LLGFVEQEYIRDESEEDLYTYIGIYIGIYIDIYIGEEDDRDHVYRYVYMY